MRRILLLVLLPLLFATNSWAGPELLFLAALKQAALPAQVTGVSASNSPAQVTVSWSSVSGATSYNVYYSTTNDSGSATKISGVTGTSKTISSGLTQGSTYYLWVSASNGSGEGALSSSVSIVVGLDVTTFEASNVNGWAFSSTDAIDGTPGINSFAHSGSASYLMTGGFDGGSDYTNGMLSKTLTLRSGDISLWFAGNDGPATVTVSAIVSGTVHVLGTATADPATWTNFTVANPYSGTVTIQIVNEYSLTSGNYIDDISLPVP